MTTLPVDRTAHGDQVRIADVPRRSVPASRTRTERAQRPVADLPLFGAAEDAKQLRLDDVAPAATALVPRSTDRASLHPSASDTSDTG